MSIIRKAHSGPLAGKKVAILAADGFEQIEMTDPRKALEKAGAQTEIVSPARRKVKGWKHGKWGDEFPVDVALDKARHDDYIGLVMPGGVMNPDKLRLLPEAAQLVRAFFDAGKPVAAICHGPWLLIEAGVLHGRRLTSWPSLKTDLMNAGAQWVDQECVIDNNLITSRNPGDIPAFNAAILEEFAKAAQIQPQEEEALAS